jgi:hypothetical protein
MNAQGLRRRVLLLGEAFNHGLVRNGLFYCIDPQISVRLLYWAIGFGRFLPFPKAVRIFDFYVSNSLRMISLLNDLYYASYLWLLESVFAALTQWYLLLILWEGRQCSR